MGDVVRDGVLLLVSEFVIIAIYIFLSDPVAQVLTALYGAGTSMGVTQMGYYSNLVNTVVTIVFILLGVIPLIWFVVRMMSREPDWGYRYY